MKTQQARAFLEKVADILGLGNPYIAEDLPYENTLGIQHGVIEAAQLAQIVALGKDYPGIEYWLYGNMIYAQSRVIQVEEGRTAIEASH